MRAEHWLQLSGDGIKLKKWDPFERRALGAGSPTHLGFHPFFLLWQDHIWSLLTLGVFLCPKAAAVLPSVGWVYFGSPWQGFAALRDGCKWTDGAHLGHSGHSGDWPRPAGLGVNVCLHAPSALQLQGLQPQTSLSALYQSHDKIILLPQDSTGVNFACCFCWWK